MGAALEIRHLVKEYVAGTPVLKDVCLAVSGSGITAVIGPSGSGKSTLLRSINRLVAPTSGEILFEGSDIVRLPRAGLRAARSRIGMVFQEYNLVERLTVMENLLTGTLGRTPALRAFLRRFAPADIALAWDTLALVGLTGFAGARADALSGGQRQRVGIARALMQQPALLLAADEPTSSLDPRTSVEIMELLAGVAHARDIPVLVTMHDVELAKRFATRIVGLSAGRVVYDGTPAGLSDAKLFEIYGGQGWQR